MKDDIRIMHLRGYASHSSKFRPVYNEKLRGVTVIGRYIWNEKENRQDIVFSWAIQCPKDTYNKKQGIKVARDRMRTGIIIQTDYNQNFPLKYQFFNAVANAREYFQDTENSNQKTKRFLDLTFYSLAGIAESSHWYMDTPSRQIPSIHPDILINYIHRMNKNQAKLEGITKIIGRSPLLTELINKSYGV